MEYPVVREGRKLLFLSYCNYFIYTNRLEGGTKLRQREELILDKRCSGLVDFFDYISNNLNVAHLNIDLTVLID